VPNRTRVVRHRYAGPLAVALALIACRGSEAGRQQDTSGTDGTTTGARAVDSVSSLASGLNARPLPKAWQEMEVEDWVRELPEARYDKSAGYETRNHRQCAGDNAPSGDCDLRIWPIVNVHTLRLASITTEGVVIARLDNVDRGGKRDALLRIPPGDSTYWVAYRDAAGSLRSAFVIPSQKGKTFSEFPFGACKGSNHAPNPSATRARFYRCADVPPSGLTPRQIDSLRMLTEHLSPPWITCAEGCCNAES
jgi:hypothetical protein